MPFARISAPLGNGNTLVFWGLLDAGSELVISEGHCGSLVRMRTLIIDKRESDLYVLHGRLGGILKPSVVISTLRMWLEKIFLAIIVVFTSFLELIE